MGILDEAIREHLELKRQHGAEDSELKQLEDEAFGPPQRPGAEPDGEGVADTAGDPAAEAPTEFMAQPDLDEAQPKEPAPAPRREMADIQEPPAPVEGEESAPEEDTGEQEAEKPEEEPPVEEERPAAEEPSATEHEAIPAPPEPGGHTTEERHAIADQPTEMYDVEDSFASTGAPAPPDEDLVAEADVGEARLGPAEKLPGADEERDEELEDGDDFFDEQRLSDELDQALEAPVQDEPEDEPEPISEEHTEVREPISEEQPVAERRDKDEDVLEETPDFLEEAPEDDQLWFEQKPPKDFDFDD